MAKNKREFVIPFIGLKIGSHTFEYEISDAFFSDLDYSIVHAGSVRVQLVLEKKETMMIGVFSCEGEVVTDCDRCNDAVRVPIEGSFQLVFKLGTDVSDDEALIVLPPESYELDVAPFIYELITVSLPTRLIHEPGECNEEMVAALSQYLVNPGDEDWDDEDEFDDDWDDEDDEWDDEDDESWQDEDDDLPGDDGPVGDIDPRWAVLKNLN